LHKSSHPENLHITGLVKIFPIYKSEEEAVKALKSGQPQNDAPSEDTGVN
jgi:hypothetical protein